MEIVCHEYCMNTGLCIYAASFNINLDKNRFQSNHKSTTLKSRSTISDLNSLCMHATFSFIIKSYLGVKIVKSFIACNKFLQNKFQSHCSSTSMCRFKFL